MISPLKRALAATALLAAMAGGSYVAWLRRPAPPRAGSSSWLDGPNLVLISIDTLRTDHLGCYGSTRDTSPAIDALARSSLVYRRAFAPAGWTFPSHVAMLTGRHPYDLGLRGDASSIPEHVPLISELLHATGFATAAFVDSGPRGFVGGERGFARGFDVFRHAPFREGVAEARKYDMAATTDAAIDWLGHRPDGRRFFLFLHTKSVHAVPRGAGCADEHCSPYWKPEPFGLRFVTGAHDALFTWSSEARGSAQDFLWALNRETWSGAFDAGTIPAGAGDILSRLYDGGIAYTDDQVGRLLAAITSFDLDRRTVIVITADHGEEFGEHGFFMHQDVYDGVLHVPLVIHLPTVAAQSSFDEPVSTTQLVPTLLDLLGIQERSLDGAARLPVRAGAAASTSPIFAFYRLPSETPFEAYALREGNWKLVSRSERGSSELVSALYDTVADPGEQSPITNEPERFGRLSEDLARRIAEPGMHQQPPGEDLHSLGYAD